MAASDPTALPDGVPAERVDELYGLPLEEFTSGRDALAKELRQAGRRDQADWVRGLRKPTAAAWLVNQLARTQKRDVGRLTEAGDRLREAHEAVLRGRGDPKELRGAAERENDAVQRLLARSGGFLDRDGHAPSPSTLERVAETLRALPADEQARAEFEAGRTTRERRASGLGPFGEGVSPPSKPSKPSKRRAGTAAAREQSGRKQRTEEKAKARQAVKDAKAEQRKRRRAVTSAERDVENARLDAERARRGLEEATSALERAQAEEAAAAAAARVAEAESGLD